MEENNTDILGEIFDKAGDATPPQERPRFEYPPEDNPPPLPPPDSAPKEKPGAAAILLPWLCMVLGAALLVMGVCLLQLMRMNDRLDSLEETVQSVALIDQLQRDNKVLQQEQEKLEQSIQQAESRAREREQDLQNVYEWYYTKLNQARQLNFLWYLSQFMEAEDYPMASAAVVFSMVPWDSQYNEYSTTQNEQYQDYKQELIRLGYVREVNALSDQQPSPYLVFAEQWDPSKSDDMAALSILWCSLSAHFVTESDSAAAQYLCLYPLGDPASGYQDRVEWLASDFTLEQFQLMKDELVENKWLLVAEDGTMSESSPTGYSPDILYGLPFELPPSQRDGNQ